MCKKGITGPAKPREQMPERTSQIAEMPGIADKMFSLPPSSGHLLTTDQFLKTRRCPLFRGFTVLWKNCYWHLIIQLPAVWNHWWWFNDNSSWITAARTTAHMKFLHGQLPPLKSPPGKMPPGVLPGQLPLNTPPGQLPLGQLPHEIPHRAIAPE